MVSLRCKVWVFVIRRKRSRRASLPIFADRDELREEKLGERRGKWNERGGGDLYLINHIRQQTLHLIVLHPSPISTTPQPNSGNKLMQRNSCPSDPLSPLSCLLEPAREENLPEKIP